MDIEKIISTIRNLKEDLPANNTGSQGAIAGFSAASTGPVAGTSPKLFSRNDSLLDQDYQTPGQSGDAEWRFSNVYPVQRLTDADVDSMVDASKEYINKVDNNNSPIINIVVNDIVEHQRFGLGLVEKIEGDIQNKKATINFKIGGRKTILLKFAKLKIKKGT